MPKLYRIYFNRLNEAPQVWSLDEGTQASEANISAVSLVNCNVVTRVDLTANRDRPKAWIETYGTLTLSEGVAVIEGAHL